MNEVVIGCEGYTSEALMRALKPYVQASVALELRPRVARVRSPALDPNVLSGIIQAGAGVLTTLITGLIAWRRSRDEAAGAAGEESTGGPIRIYGADGTVVEIPIAVDGKTLALLMEEVRRTPRTRIELL